MNRRFFLFAAPAIVAASNLMPVSTLALPCKRLILNSSLTIYVRPDGADGAFRTVQGAVNYVQRFVYLNGHQVTMHVPDDSNWGIGVTRPIA